MTALTPDQKQRIIATAQSMSVDAAIELCEQYCIENLAATVFNRGGYGMLQLNPNPHAVPRLKFIDSARVPEPVDVIKLDGIIYARNSTEPQPPLPASWPNCAIV